MLANAHPVIAERKKITKIEYVIDIKVSVHCVVPQCKLHTHFGTLFCLLLQYFVTYNYWFNFLQRCKMQNLM